MSKRFRQYAGILSAVAAYYVIHEGAHLLYALMLGVFKKIRFMGLGMQIDVFADRMTDNQMGLFCLLGSVATLICAYILVFLSKRIGEAQSKTLRACMYYITIILLLLDPVYLSFLFMFFGGGDMNGISLIVPKLLAQCIYGAVLLINILVFWKLVLPRYKASFEKEALKK